MQNFIPVYQPDLSGNELSYVTDCIKSSWVSSLGEYIDRFERGFASFCGVKHGISVANGTVALHLALAAHGIGPGDEVILPTLTFIATANVVHYTGATPVFVDSDSQTWQMDVNEVAKKISIRTKAILPVHLYGHPVDMAPLMELAAAHQIFVVEDAAEAHGAEYRGRRVGGLGHVGCFSFYGNKIITTGEGGMLVTDDDELAARLHFLKDHGMSKERRYYHPEVGYNYRMTNIQAALGVAQLERIEQFSERKQEIASMYQELLGGCPGLVTHPQAPWARNSYWMYSVLVREHAKLSRDALMAHLKAQGIDSRPFFIPIHQMPPYREEEIYPIAEELSQTGMNLPSYPAISDEDIMRISGTIREALG